MKIELVYLRVIGPSSEDAPPPSYYEPFTRRFVRTYRFHRTMMDIPLHVVFCGPGEERNEEKLFGDLNPVYHRYTGSGWDFGAFQSVANELDCDMVFWMSTPVYFWKAGWLERIVQEIERNGDGLYGVMASNQICPHIRTACAAWSPAEMRSFPTQITSHKECGYAEVGFTKYIQEKNKPVKLVTWDGCYDQPDWRKPDNIFRRGDQSNCMVWDRHADIYACSNYWEQCALEAAANGPPQTVPDLPNPL